MTLAPPRSDAAELPAGDTRGEWWDRAVWVAVAVACAVAVATYVAVALLRIGHPFELQWMEGGSVDHVQRLLDGRSIYPAPSIGFASFTYPPLYWLLSAPVAALIGNGFLPLRLVSLLASIGTMAVLAWHVRRRTADNLAALLSAGVFGAAFRVTGAWYDVARVDSLFVLLLVAGTATLAAAKSRKGAAAAGALFALAALTKQPAVFVTVPLGVLLLATPSRRRQAVPFLAAFAIPVTVVTAALSAATNGWYWFETVEVLVGHPVEPGAIVGFPIRDIALHLAPAIALLAVAALRSRVWRRWNVELVAAAGMLGAAWIARLHRGGYDDVLIPAFAAAALLAGLAVGELRARDTAAPGRRSTPRLAVAAACLAQLALLAYNPVAQVPTTSDAAAGERLIAAIRAVDGDVLVLSHPWYGVMAGKPSHVQAAAYFDIVRSDDPSATRQVRESVAAAIRARRFAAVVLDTPGDERAFLTTLEAAYRRIDPPTLARGEPGLRPVTDVEVRPTFWWLRR